MKTYKIDYEVTLRGTIEVEARDAQHAKEIANCEPWNDTDFYNRAETIDWKVTGEPEEVK